MVKVVTVEALKLTGGVVLFFIFLKSDYIYIYIWKLREVFSNTACHSGHVRRFRVLKKTHSSLL